MSSAPAWAKEVLIPEQKSFDGVPFPMVLSPATEALAASSAALEVHACVRADMQWIAAQLLERGAIVFRGFPTRDAAAFDAFVNAFPDYEILPYVGGAAVRNHVVGNVYTTNESPADQKIPFHHEMAQVPKPPSTLFFMCEVPPASGGETPILLSNELFKRAHAAAPAFIDKLETVGVRYARSMLESDDPTSAIGRGWKSTYLTDKREEAEAKQLAQNGSFEWLENGTIFKSISAALPAIRTDARNGKKTFFNSVVAAYTGWQDARNDSKKAVVFADGEYLAEADVAVVQSIMDEIKVEIPWQNGDVMLIDNRQVMHSRNTFQPPRQIYAILLK